MPAEFVLVLVTMFVPTFRIDTSAPTTVLPVGSVTIPVTVARSPCPKAAAVNSADRTRRRPNGEELWESISTSTISSGGRTVVSSAPPWCLDPAQTTRYHEVH